MANPTDKLADAVKALVVVIPPPPPKQETEDEKKARELAEKKAGT